MFIPFIQASTSPPTASPQLVLVGFYFHQVQYFAAFGLVVAEVGVGAEAGQFEHFAFHAGHCDPFALDELPAEVAAHSCAFRAFGEPDFGESLPARGV